LNIDDGVFLTAALVLAACAGPAVAMVRQARVKKVLFMAVPG